ncbi:DUF2977 domain-containing protein [Leuconostoc mesenteroides]|uniref:DUF2977 domain-containing protein n=1 Tax=Leuconostoc mesenteroides TaxID=1245 RepID=UPI003883C736
MKIKIDSNEQIIGYVLIGDNPDYDTAVDVDKLPEDFFDNFVPEYYLFVNGNVVTNPNYVQPAIPSEPKTVGEMISDLTQQLAFAQIAQTKTNAQLIQQNTVLVKQLADLQSEKETNNG